MEDWQEKAIEYFPEFKKYHVSIVNSEEIFVSSPVELWLDLEESLYSSVKQNEGDLQKRIFLFANYCTSESVESTYPQVAQAVRCGFLWSLGQHPEVWSFLPVWLNVSEFNKFFSEMTLSLREEEKQMLLNVYKQNKA